MRTIIGIALLGLATTAAAAEIPKVLPGEWQMSSTMHMTTMPDMPPQALAMMKAQQGKPSIMRYCLTPEQAAEGPEKAMARANCKVENFSYAGGRMTGESVCTNNGHVTRSKMTGTYSPTGYTMDGSMSSSGGKSGPMAMTMHIEGKRLAPTCSAATAKTAVMSGSKG